MRIDHERARFGAYRRMSLSEHAISPFAAVPEIANQTLYDDAIIRSPSATRKIRVALPPIDRG